MLIRSDSRRAEGVMTTTLLGMELIGVAALFVVLALLAALPLVVLLHLVEATSPRKVQRDR